MHDAKSALITLPSIFAYRIKAADGERESFAAVSEQPSERAPSDLSLYARRRISNNARNQLNARADEYKKGVDLYICSTVFLPLSRCWFLSAQGAFTI